MLDVGRQERVAALHCTRGDQRIREAEAVGESEAFDVEGCSVANRFGEGEDAPVVQAHRLAQKAQFGCVPNALQQLHVGDRGERDGGVRLHGGLR